ncbi:MAG: iron ABC transporter permease [Clostridiales bacterium]|nr:iron ABC transporter permease [Clostridiales bacterium]
MLGTIEFSVSEALKLIKGSVKDELINQVIVNVRLPRILTGVLVGMNLGVAGVLLQGLIRNPMASPNVIGVNAGAGLSAVIVMTLLPEKIEIIPLAAFVGAVAAAALVYTLTRTSNRDRVVHIALAGVAVSSLLKAVTSGLMMINSDILDITYSWLMGSLSGRTWPAFKTILPYSLAALTISLIISPKMNLLGLGDEVAGSVGLPVRFYRLLIISTAAILAGSAVSVAGTIGFVGLIAPNSARLFVGSDHRYLVPLSAIFGGILLTLSDTIARTVFQPIEISVGIITSVLGAPFFLALLYKRGKERSW